LRFRPDLAEIATAVKMPRLASHKRRVWPAFAARILPAVAV